MAKFDAECPCTCHMHKLQFTLSSCRVCPIHPLYLAAMSSSSPPQPQYWFGKPFIFMYWSGVTADTPPKYCGYGSLGRSHYRCTILKIMSQSNALYIEVTSSHTFTLRIYLYLNLSMATDRCVGNCLWQV